MAEIGLRLPDSLSLIVRNFGWMILFYWKWNMIVAFIHWFAPGLGRSAIISIASMKEEHHNNLL